MTNNEALVKQMIEKREAEPEDIDEIPGIEGEWDLEEIETLKMENIALKRERLRTDEMLLMGEQEQLKKRIRDRLGVTDEYGLSFNLPMTKVRVEKRRATSGQRQEQQELDASSNENGA